MKNEYKNPFQEFGKQLYGANSPEEKIIALVELHLTKSGGGDSTRSKAEMKQMV